MINFTLQGLDSSPEQVALRLSSSEIKPPLIMSSKVGDLKKKLCSSQNAWTFSKINFVLQGLDSSQNRWHCDCHLLALHNWLQNFTVPNSVEPRCHSPPRLISEPIKNLSPQEFACIPKVSPTSMYLEVIEGKNMSLVCSIEVRSKLKEKLSTSGQGRSLTKSY